MMRKSIFTVLLLLALLLVACQGNVATQEAPPASPTAEELESGDAGEAAAVSETGFSCNPTGDEPGQFSAPEQVIQDGYDYIATITMENGGQIVIELLPDAAPASVNNFVFLACQGYYDGVTFHRVLDDFMAQGGDPTGTGTGGPGYTIPDEHDNGYLFDQPGRVAMARTNQPNTAGSQFFITFVPYPSLNQQYTIFGNVVEGMDVVNAITRRDPQMNPSAPAGDAMATVRVEAVPRG